MNIQHDARKNKRESQDNSNKLNEISILAANQQAVVEKPSSESGGSSLDEESDDDFHDATDNEELLFDIAQQDYSKNNEKKGRLNTEEESDTEGK